LTLSGALDPLLKGEALVPPNGSIKEYSPCGISNLWSLCDPGLPYSPSTCPLPINRLFHRVSLTRIFTPQGNEVPAPFASRSEDRSSSHACGVALLKAFWPIHFALSPHHSFLLVCDEACRLQGGEKIKGIFLRFRKGNLIAMANRLHNLAHPFLTIH